jgi:flavin-dependent dehydrogenase
VKLFRAHVAFLGGGPGGSGPLYAAIKRGDAGRLLGSGARWLEAGPGFGSGTIGSYKIASDTQADVLLECLPKEASEALGDVIDTDEKRLVERYLGGPLPLEAASRFLARAGESARRLVDRTPESGVESGVRVTAVHVEDDGFRVRGRSGTEEIEIRSNALVSALGGLSAKDMALDAELLDRRTVRSLGLRCVVTTDELFRNDIARYTDVLPKGRPVKVAVLGGSHSAYATAVKLLNELGSENVRIRVLCRRLPKLFYPTLERAHAEGYTRATLEDVCPVTKRVFRLAGLRLAARALVQRVWGLGDAARETSVTIEHLPDHAPSFAGEAMLDADLCVLALGYRARTVDFFHKGERLPLLTQIEPKKPLVDSMCRLLLADGTPLPRAFGLGLASGFVPHGTMGGEPSFDGQTNGLWLYQNDVGERVLDQVLAAR